MRITELLLPKKTNDKSLSSKKTERLDFLKARMTKYVDKIGDPKLSVKGREFLKTKLKADYDELRKTLESTISEAVHKLPLTPEDFDLVKDLMTRPIPAAVAPIYIQSIIEDDEFFDQLRSIEDAEPDRDVRPLVVEWFKRVMPDQMHRFGQEVASAKLKQGTLSPIHGYDSKMYKGTNDPITGNAYGFR